MTGEWLPLRDGVLRLLPAEAVQEICDQTARTWHIGRLSFDPDACFFEIERSTVPAAPEEDFEPDEHGQPEHIGFRLGDDIEVILLPVPGPEARRRITEAVSDLRWRLGRKLLENVSNGLWSVRARPGSVLAPPQGIDAGTLEHLRVTDWARGVAASNNGETIYSVEVTPAANQPPQEAKAPPSPPSVKLTKDQGLALKVLLNCGTDLDVLRCLSETALEKFVNDRLPSILPTGEKNKRIGPKPIRAALRAAAQHAPE